MPGKKVPARRNGARSTTRLPTSFRLPDELRDQLRDAALKQERSVNNLVVHLLRQGLARLESSPPHTPA